MTTAATPAVSSIEGDAATDRPGAEIVRDITAGGVAGLIVGVLLAGIGGRLVMRLAAITVPTAVGSFTENGNRIGDVTIGGTIGIVLGIGLLFGAVAGVLWVTARPWIPGPTVVRALLSIPLALALGAFALIRDENPDFSVLEHDPVIVGSLVVLVALFGPLLAFTEAWLDRRLPHRATESGYRAYLAVTIVGIALMTLFVLPMYLGSELLPAGMAFVVTGLATLAWWYLRARGAARPPLGLVLIGRAGLLAATVLGLVVALPEITGALRLD